MVLSKARLLAEIIIRIKLRCASSGEREVLVKWLDEDEDNRQLYKNIIRGISIAKRLKLEDEINRTTDFDEVHKEVSSQLLAGKIQRRRWILWGSIAAACMIGFIWFVNSYKNSEISPLPTIVKLEEPKPEIKRGKVMMILENGEQINLQGQWSDSIQLAKVNLGGENVCISSDTIIKQEAIRRILTTVGGDYNFILSDGTKVWLNSESEIDYPVEFLGDRREVFVKGEVYFEVAHNPEKPFIVKTASLQTKVLGTTFNITAYEDEQDVYTTLLTGKVEVSVNGEKNEIAPIVLKPSMQLRLKKGSGEVSVKKVKVEDAIAWRHGAFVFNEDDIEVVTRMLSRWYDVEFVFDGGRKGTHTFSGRMSKDEDLETILKSLTFSGGPEFRIVGNKVHIIEN